MLLPAESPSRNMCLLIQIFRCVSELTFFDASLGSGWDPLKKGRRGHTRDNGGPLRMRRRIAPFLFKPFGNLLLPTLVFKRKTDRLQ